MIETIKKIPHEALLADKELREVYNYLKGIYTGEINPQYKKTNQQANGGSL